MSFAPKPGCPMCGIVSQQAGEGEVIWRDENFTAYKEKANPVSTKGHIVVAFNLHVPSIYTLSSSDLPLLVNIRNLATRLLSSSSTAPSSSTSPPPTPGLSSTPSTSLTPSSTEKLNIGFITPPFKDPKIPVTDHLHCHAYIGKADKLGWWRAVAYSSLAWYDIDDLIAEIRESVSNNRVKSGYENRTNAPIDAVPDAGSRSGSASGVEASRSGIAGQSLDEQDLEAGAQEVEFSAPGPSRSGSLLSPTSPKFASSSRSPSPSRGGTLLSPTTQAFELPARTYSPGAVSPVARSFSPSARSASPRGSRESEEAGGTLLSPTNPGPSPTSRAFSS